MEDYDIFLIRECYISEQASSNVTEVLRGVTDTHLQPGSQLIGFLGLNMPLNIAKRLMKELRKLGGRGYVLRSDYRGGPKISFESATHIAQEELLRKQQTKYANVEFDPPQYTRAMETVMFWTFSSVSEEWVQQGLVPGALFASVDKLDGHVWQQTEFEELASNQE